MRINTNVASLTAQEAATNTNKALSASLEKLGSGLRINKAADDASGMSIADKLRTQASSIGQGISNANSASAMIQIADKAMAEQSNILDIVKTKLIQASTSTTSTEGRESIRKDISKLLEQFDSIAGQTNYNGTSLLQKGSTDTSRADTFTFQLGEEASFNVSTQASKASNTVSLGGGSDTITTGDNIGVGESLQIKTDALITISDIDVDVDGVDTTATLGLDLNVSGKMGQVTANDGDLTIDATNQSTEIIDALDAMALQSVIDGGDFSGANGTYTIASGGVADFGDIDFSAVKLTGAAAEDTIELNGAAIAGTILTITNNNADTTKPNKGQLDIAGTGMTGGNLLSDLKNLAADGLTAEKANSFMATIDEALSQLNTNRSDFGSTQNQLESSIRNMQTTQTNLKAAESVIRDVDYAAESANFNKQNIISQAGTYAMSQANNVQQNVMKLLQ